MLYDGGRKACDAVLRASGRRLTHGTGHHAEYIAEARRLLGDDGETTRLLSRVDAARSIRNDTQYQTREVTDAELDDLRSAAASLLLLARTHEERHCT